MSMMNIFCTLSLFCILGDLPIVAVENVLIGSMIVVSVLMYPSLISGDVVTGLERAGEVGSGMTLVLLATLGMVGTGRLKVVGFIWDWGLQAERGLTDALTQTSGLRARPGTEVWMEGPSASRCDRSCGCCEGHLE